MIKIPVNQTTTGDGNKEIQGGVVSGRATSLHCVYSGSGSASLSVYVSNENSASNWASIGSITLTASDNVQAYDVKGRYANLKVTVDSITDGSVTVEIF